MWTRARLWLASVFRRRRFDAALAEELAFHLDARTEHWTARGLSPSEARRRARVEFGGVDKASADVRDARRGAWVESLVRDVGSGLRALRRYPAFSATAVLSLAICIGATTAIFSVVNAVLFRASPLGHQETLVNIYETRSAGTYDPLSHPNIKDLRDATKTVFIGLAASTFAIGQIDDPAGGDTLMGEAVTGGAFTLLGIAPRIGRAIQPDDDVARGGHPVVVLSYRYWRRAFGGDLHVVGQTLRLSGRNYTIIGVAPADYPGGLPAVQPAFYVPMSMLDELMGIDILDARNVHNFFVRARRAPSVPPAQAEQAVADVAASLTERRPAGWVPGETFALVPTADVTIHPGLDPLLRAASWLLLTAVGLVLMLACTNLASFMLARAIDRRQEVAVRRALGATRGALARQFLVESTLLGLLGAAAGLALAMTMIGVLTAADPPLPFGMKLDLQLGLGWKMLLDWNALIFTATLGLLAGSVLGLVPAVQGTRADPGGALKTRGTGRDAPASMRWRSALVVAQVAMSLVLLVGAGLFVRSWRQTLEVDPGFGRAPTSVLDVMLPVAQLKINGAIQHTQQLLDRFRALPGVAAVGLIQPMPLDLSTNETAFTVDGHVPLPGQDAFRADYAFVDGGFFDAAGIPVLEGRTFTDADKAGSPAVAVVSRAMARRFWPDGRAVGRILRRPDPAEADLLIVGVAGDIKVRSLGESPPDMVYAPYTQSPGLPMLTFLARTTGDPAALARMMTVVGRGADASLRIVQAQTMTQRLAQSRLPAQMGAYLMLVFAILSMTLAAIGLYGMVRYTVTARTHEMGIRIALGADARSVVHLLAKGGMRLVLLGVAIGVVASLMVARVLTTLLFGVGALDPVAFTLAPVMLCTIAWLASYLPARRAGRVNLLAALRSD
jgi:predicted permease